MVAGSNPAAPTPNRTFSKYLQIVSQGFLPYLAAVCAILVFVTFAVLCIRKHRCIGV